MLWNLAGEFKFNIKAQLSVQMLSCIRASISAECALNLVTSGENYEIEVKKGAHTIKVPNGLLYLSILVSRIMIDWYLQCQTSKDQSELDDYMVSINSNVTAFMNLWGCNQTT